MAMVRDLLLVEVVLKAVSGGLLFLFPRTLARVLGLPPVTETFWPRLLGAVLISLGVATFLEVHLEAKSGLGLAGQVAVNIGTVLALVGLLIMGKAGSTRRGRALVGLVTIAITLLALIELAWI